MLIHYKSEFKNSSYSTISIIRSIVSPLVKWNNDKNQSQKFKLGSPYYFKGWHNSALHYSVGILSIY